ncbi:MAG TPA: glycosyltransferase family 9 protein [Flavobacterium sp.]|jgi:heptosyltransferase-2
MANPPQKILVIQLKMIGDVLISSIICNNLKAKYPTAQIDYLVYPFTKPVTENNPGIDNVIAFPEAARTSKPALLRFVRDIRKAKYDIVIDAYSKLESCLVTMFSGAERRIGYAGKGLPFSYNEKVPYPMKPESVKGLAIERREKLIQAVTTDSPDLYPKLFLTCEEIESAKATLQAHDLNLSETIVMIGVLGSDESKTYPAQYMAGIVDRLALENTKILFNYMPKQAVEVRLIYDFCKPETQRKIVFDLIASDLRSFMAIMSHCSFIVGNDGGAINIAKALNKPSFTIFSPWIEKSSWSIFEDGVFHKAVHLNDYHPELISNKPRKTLQSKYEKYYLMLRPDLIMPQFDEFLAHHLGISDINR